MYHQNSNCLSNGKMQSLYLQLHNPVNRRQATSKLAVLAVQTLSRLGARSSINTAVGLRYDSGPTYRPLTVCVRARPTGHTTAKRYEKQAANEMYSPRLCLAWDHDGLTGSFVLSNALRTKSDRKQKRGIYERGCCLLLWMVEDNHILILICDFVWNANISYWACCYRRNGLRTSNKS